MRAGQLGVWARQCGVRAVRCAGRALRGVGKAVRCVGEEVRCVGREVRCVGRAVKQVGRAVWAHPVKNTQTLRISRCFFGKSSKSGEIQQKVRKTFKSDGIFQEIQQIRAHPAKSTQSFQI